MSVKTDLSTTLGPLRLKNPLLLASGTCGYGIETGDLVDLQGLGAVVVKGLSLEPRAGNPPPRLAETPCGLLNSIGLENIGVEAFVKTRLPLLRKKGTVIIANILGNSVEEYGELASILDRAPGVAALEVNISCPNVKEGGVAFGTDPRQAAQVTRTVKAATSLPVIVKLTPNVTDICAIGKAVQEAGADAVSAINTLLGMAIDIEKRRPALSNVMGGLSGPAIKPVALRMVWQLCRSLSIPVIGIGGISSPVDALEFLMAGAAAIQIGTGFMVEPTTAEKIIQGIREFMDSRGIGTIRELAIQDS